MNPQPLLRTTHAVGGLDNPLVYDRWGGSGRPVVLLHGLLFDRTMWWPLAAELRLPAVEEALVGRPPSAAVITAAAGLAVADAGPLPMTGYSFRSSSAPSPGCWSAPPGRRRCALESCGSSGGRPHTLAPG